MKFEFTNLYNFISLSPKLVQSEHSSFLHRLSTPFQLARAEKEKIANYKDIYFGIKTGFNKAFIIDNHTKDALVSQDSNSEDLLKPLLRGRDIGRYQSNWRKIWLIDTHNGYGNTPPINVELYPAIKQHLDSFSPKLGNRYDKGITKYNLRSCAYHAQFDKEKIIYPIITKNLTFAYDSDGMFTNDKCFIMTGQNLKFLLAWFNSRLFRTLFRDNFPSLGSGRELRKVFFRDIRVPKVTDIDPYIIESIEPLVNKAIKLKQQNLTASYFSTVQEIDQIIFKICNLVDKEIRILDRLS